MKAHRAFAIALGTTALSVISWALHELRSLDQCSCCILDPWRAVHNRPPAAPRKKAIFPWKGLVFFPGHGEQTGRRTDILRLSIAAYNPDDWDCIVFYYGKDPPSEQWSEGIHPCVVMHGPGLAFGDWMLKVTPKMVESAGYTHISVHLNDVQYQEGTDPASIVAEMQHMELEVASPNVIGSVWPSMCKEAVNYEMPGWQGKRGKLVRPLQEGAEEGWLVRFIEIQVTTFTAQAWSCWWEMINPEVNPSGWDYDLCFFRFCRAPRMGVLGGYTAVHWGRYPRVVGGVPGTNNLLGREWNDTTRGIYRKWLLEKWHEGHATANESLVSDETAEGSWMCMD